MTCDIPLKKGYNEIPVHIGNGENNGIQYMYEALVGCVLNPH